MSNFFVYSLQQEVAQIQTEVAQIQTETTQTQTEIDQIQAELASISRIGNISNSPFPPTYSDRTTYHSGRRVWNS